MAERHNYDGADVPDQARTSRAHAGEGLEDTRNWPGIILVALGLFLLGSTLAAAGYGFEGWAWIAGPASVVCFLAGVAVIILEHRRIKKLEGRDLADQAGH